MNTKKIKRTLRCIWHDEKKNAENYGWILIALRKKDGKSISVFDENTLCSKHIWKQIEGERMTFLNQRNSGKENLNIKHVTAACM